MLAGASKPFDSDEHLFEVKWDGIRALAFVEGDGYRLLTRHHRDVTDQFPELDGLARLGPGVVLDGELVVLRDAMPHLGSVGSRQHTADPLKIRRLAQAHPFTFGGKPLAAGRGRHAIETLTTSARRPHAGWGLRALRQRRVSV